MLFNINEIQIICIFQQNKSYFSNKVLTKIITMNEGSHTKFIGYKCNCITQLKPLQQAKKKYVMFG